MKSQEWRSYLAESPGDALGERNIKAAILKDLEAAETRAEREQRHRLWALRKLNHTRELKQGWAECIFALRETETRAEALETECRRLREEEPRIREYLAFSHVDGKCNIYADDGELQCANLARHSRTIDFRREPIADLLDIIIGTRQREYAAALTPPEAQGRELDGYWPGDDLRRAFVAGAKWWEFESTKGTMWPSDRDKAEVEAERRYPEGKAERRATGEQPHE